MTLITISSFVRCSFYPDEKMVSNDLVSTAEVFFAKTKDLSSGISSLRRYINKDDQLKADRLHNSEDKKTNLICFTLLRMILSKKLNKSPHDISYINGRNGKPGIKDNSLFFNISHTRDSFAIAISEHSYIGVDLEDLSKSLDFESIIKRVFSGKEGEFILKSSGKSRNRFFLLWTRKEALLKAIGTGIIPHLSQIEVLRPVNLINRNSIDDLADVSVSDQHYIYSKKLYNYYLSVALPQKAKIVLSHLDEKVLNTYFQ
jgi:4'-phosphopantetheinyl transferase